ncbi:aliphatic sulfonate ABC transporter substrate-binding protein [Bacillus sp. HMF5848]|uniref:aliphatic sulfonate ABC transporter substrate-binding protein n=1 Tax=Bacillus sp. HMF5848 TaxID=2495421 RepID=UPI000F79B05D|nr:aliphatic sulfonate ABC transporter substrate-binding protein [Bacillus sp. HMF5848]RSK26803.1 aliphatic sulfonate ABC transporter substrate-binding protein [Bacillus sp. HMF5848]
MKKLVMLVASAILLVGVLAGCASNKNSSATPEKIVIGYFPNINHVPAMVAKEKGFFEEKLDGLTVEYKTFPDGSSFMTALVTGEIQAGLVGPGPAMNNYTSGADVKVIAGASTGGTVIMARKDAGISTIQDFSGKTFITPRVGCTHDVQLETYLSEVGLTSERIGGTMKHQTGNPSQYAALFQTGKVDIAAAPEPWASVLEEEVGAIEVIGYDEVSWGTTLPAAVLVATGDLVENNTALVQSIVDAHKQAVEFIESNPEEAKAITIKDIKAVTNQELKPSVVERAWERIGFTYALDKQAIQEFGNSSYELNFLKEKPDFTNLIDSQFID